MTLLKLRQGDMVFSEFKVHLDSPFAGKRVDEIELPADTVLVAVVSHGGVVIPKADTVLRDGDEVLAVTTPEGEKLLARMK